MGIKATLKDIQSGFLSATVHTANNTLIEEALDRGLDRTANVNNAMEVDLDLGLNNIINLKDGYSDFHAINYRQMNKIVQEIIGKDKHIVRLRDPRQVASQGQKTFYTSSVSLVPGNNSVATYINGVSQVEGIDFATEVDKIVFVEGLDAGDFVDMYINESQSNTLAQMDRSEQIWDNTAGTSTFNMKYSVGNLEVFLNGVKLKNQDDYLATDGQTIVLTVPVGSNSDFLEAISESNFTIANHYEKQDVYRKDETYSKLETYAKPEVYNRAETDAAILAAEQALFTGAVIASASGVVKAGYLECNGQAINRLAFPQLFAEIGTIYGVGNGINTFNVPDYRGEFLRGFDNGKGVDSGRTLGSNQSDELKAHTHGYDKGTSQNDDWGGNNPGIRDDIANIQQTTSIGGSETRPRNVSIMWLIKY